MSHVATIDLEVHDLDCLAQAAEDIGCELARDQTTYRWWGRSVGDYPMPDGFTESDLGKCSHAIRVKGKPEAYEVGVVPARGGKKGFTLLYDFYGGGKGLEAAVGKDAGKLKQSYAARVAEKALKRKGYKIKKHVDERGRIILRGE